MSAEGPKAELRQSRCRKGQAGMGKTHSSVSSGPTTPGSETTRHQEAIKSLDAVADIGIKLSTTLVGLGAAILLGFKSGLTLTTPIRAFILLAIMCFLESALYAVLWRMRIAELWINDCLGLVVEPRLQYRFTDTLRILFSRPWVVGVTGCKCSFNSA
jgi:hypothetical protein